jgi:hypothetical protein
MLSYICRWFSNGSVITWWEHKSTGGERYIVRASEWRAGRFRGINPLEVYVFHDTYSSDPDPLASSLEIMSGREFAELIAGGSVHQIT